MRKSPWLFAALLVFACAHGFHDSTGWTPQPPGPDADPQAQKLIDDMWAAMGALPTFQTHGELRFTWNYYDGGSLKKSEVFYWNRFESRLRWEEAAAEGDWVILRMDLKKHTGRAYAVKRTLGGKGAPGQMNAQSTAAASAGAANAPNPSPGEVLPNAQFEQLQKAATVSFDQSKRWLLGPLSLRDVGVKVKVEADQPAPEDQSGKQYKVLHVTFAENADFEHKGDQYWWLLDPATHLPVWMYWQQEGHEGKSAWSQEDWQDVGNGFKLPLTHRQFKTQIEIKFANVQVNSRPDDDLYFETLK